MEFHEILKVEEGYSNFANSLTREDRDYYKRWQLRAHLVDLCNSDWELSRGVFKVFHIASIQFMYKSLALFGGLSATEYIKQHPINIVKFKRALLDTELK